ncbi:MAG: V-type ATP synthase subunit A [Actinomycetota bacterium]
MSGSVAPARGTVVRVSGPLIEVEGLTGMHMLDVLRVGTIGLPGEVVSIAGGRVTAQVYEYTDGLRPGEAVRSDRLPLSARFGPGMLGQVFDGLLRPLGGGPAQLRPGVSLSQIDRPWHFSPRATVGTAVGPGAVLGVVQETSSLEHRILVPPEARGMLERLAPEGDYSADEEIADVGGSPVPLAAWWPVRRPRPYRRRRWDAVPLVTGQRVLDVLFPVARGSTAAVPGGFGTGKTVLLHQIAKWCDADVIVYVGCGERGNEMVEVLEDIRSLEDPRTGTPLAARTVIIANTSNMPVMAREMSIYSGMTVAEYFRDQGYDAVLIADSTSRWAEAMREFSSRTGELPAEEGFPASLPSALAAFYERAGTVETLGGAEASVTVLAAVSPPGGDLTEPVSAHTQRFVRCLWSLDRDLAYAHHYPAVGWTGSFSRDVDSLAAWYVRRDDVTWARRRARLTEILAEADRLQSIADLIGLAAMPGHERIVLLGARLIREGILQQNALSENDGTCGPDKERALVEMVLDIYDRMQHLVGGGVLVTLIEELDLSDALRARDDVASNDAAGVTRAREVVLARLEALA